MNVLASLPQRLRHHLLPCLLLVPFLDVLVAGKLLVRFLVLGRALQLLLQGCVGSGQGGQLLLHRHHLHSLNRLGK